MDPEQTDFIPWSQLDQLTSRRNWLGYAVVGVLVAGIVWVVTNRAGGAKIVEVAPERTTSVSVPTADAAASEIPDVPEVPPAATTVPAPQILSEADLAAALPLDGAEHPPGTPALVAEWFVREYFTVSDSPAEWLDAVPDPLPHTAGDGARTYVSWVQALSVNSLDGQHVEVTVAVGVQRLDVAEGWVEEPVRPVAVVLRRHGAAWVPVDLPAPTVAERLDFDFVSATPLEVVPDPVSAAADKLAAAAGGEAQVVSIGENEGRYRVVIMVGSSMRWPLVGWFAADGTPTVPAVP